MTAEEARVKFSVPKYRRIYARNLDEFKRWMEINFEHADPNNWSIFLTPDLVEFQKKGWWIFKRNIPVLRKDCAEFLTSLGYTWYVSKGVYASLPSYKCHFKY